jgi:hypothetical protein
VSFHLDLFIYEWEMVCGFSESSAFVSRMKYIRNQGNLILVKGLGAIGELTSWVHEWIIDDVWISQEIG